MKREDTIKSLNAAVRCGRGPVLVLVHDYPDPDSLAGALVADVGAVPEPDLLAVVSDVMLRAKGTMWCFATGTHAGCTYLSLRVRSARRNAGRIIRDVMGEAGYGGKHGLAAGGVIRPDDGDVRRASREAIQGVLRTVGRDDHVGQKLCNRRSHLL
jgi:nanoRNase/pAp phosphatase (c-di-AMP/oligoRNAs hydrolase)